MREAAFRWWNALISPDRDASSVPEIQEELEMSVIWSNISPLLHSLFCTEPNKGSYWQSIVEQLKQILNINEIPDPLVNFPDFVVFLYKYQTDLKLDTMDKCINHINQFCKDNYSQFFLRHFICVVSDPSLTIRVFNYLQIHQNPKWIKFITENGSIERIIDLFITFLEQNPDSNKSHSNSQDNLELADLLTSLVLQAGPEITLAEGIFSSLYARLLKLIKYSSNEDSISFFRCIVQLNQCWLPNATQEDALSRISSLVASTTQSPIVRSLVLKYSYQQVGKYIKADQFIEILMKQALNSVYEMQILHDTALQSSEEALLTTMRFFTRKMTTSKIYMRLSASFLADVLIKLGHNDEAIKWFKLYANGLFCFVKLATIKNKYLHRVLQLLTILSEDTFSIIPWAKQCIESAASACSQSFANVEFLSNFFQIKKVSNVENFQNLYKRLSSSTSKLKTFPFKSTSSTLIESGSYRQKVKLPYDVEDVCVCGTLRNIGIHPTAYSYVYSDLQKNNVDQQRCIFELEDFIDYAQEFLDSLHVSKDSKQYPLPSQYSTTNKILAAGCRSLLLDYDTQISEYQISIVNDFVRIACELVGAVTQHQHVFVNIKMLQRNMINEVNSSQNFFRLRRQRTKIDNKCQQLTKLPHINLSDIRQQVTEIKSRLGNNPFSLQQSDLEYQLQKYFSAHPSPERYDVSAVKDLICGNVAEFLQKIFMHENYIYNKLKLNFDPIHQILVVALIRNSFDSAYISAGTSQLDLCSFSKQNQLFLSKAPLVLKIPTQKLKLNTKTMKKASKFATLGALVNRKPITISDVQWYNNPIDITRIILTAIKSLPSLCDVDNLSQSEISALLLGVIAKDPPANVVSVAAFLDRYYQLLPSLEMSNAVDRFRDAVNLLIDMKEVKEEQMERDNEMGSLNEIGLSLLKAAEQAEE
ncbi:hypothetical protein TVAG_248920 [Trichomonas vaginalis G3]|uniref:Uncharacterized protein n=1 Tax=Trichomonas vaginalis (strain ATCC PRA-98 / G3) TaxID=412133 RepID=A2DC96_TRIV3|nr:hypothetical protein TVAGG3_0957960 [Trichomonas vaginalis G3]EAY21833.1 hypothetical protein TVAG_248920 [Trichomonas vaginalis G3]KAI5487697.1 hypothetical protein TVAGG3_0957960 [Trichomonas vaginalis G3]|eukprot:XP_001582819.1 hypothetical protein [Trichomonas vaginalis G3]